jgi:2-oxoglutarate ferredoxin oxidoreductase subunit gamma
MRVRFSGLGGQGVVISGVIYGHAAMYDGLNVLQNQSYGSTTRGGVTTSDVTIDRDEIHELECPDFDVVIALCQDAYDRFVPLVLPGGVVITERSLVDADPVMSERARHVAIPALETARDQMGRQILANIVVLGALSALVDAVTVPSLEAAIAAHVPEGTTQVNLKAFHLGRSLLADPSPA